MKITCGQCGIHFPQDFEKSLVCDFWKERGADGLPVKYKKIIWDWIFSLPVDEILIATKYSINASWGAEKVDVTNQFEKNVPGYVDWTEKEQQHFQRRYAAAMRKMTKQKMSSILVRDFYENKYKKNGKN